LRVLAHGLAPMPPTVVDRVDGQPYTELMKFTKKRLLDVVVLSGMAINIVVIALILYIYVL